MYQNVMEDVGRYSTQQVKHGLSGRILTGPKLHCLLPCACAAALEWAGLVRNRSQTADKAPLFFSCTSLFVAASTVTSAGQNWQLGGGGGGS